MKVLRDNSTDTKNEEVATNSNPTFNNQYLQQKLQENINIYYDLPLKCPTISTNNSINLSIVNSSKNKNNVLSHCPQNRTLSNFNINKQRINLFKLTKKPISNIAHSKTQYGFLQNNKKCKYLQSKDIDNILTIPNTNRENTEFRFNKNRMKPYRIGAKFLSQKTCLKKKVKGSINLSNTSNNKNSSSSNHKSNSNCKRFKKAKTNVSNIIGQKQSEETVIEKNIFNKAKISYYQNQKKNLGNFIDNKFTKLNQFIIKATNPDDVIEEHLWRDRASDRYIKFKLFMKKQEWKNTKLLDSVKRAAAINESMVKVGFIQMISRENLALWKKKRELKKKKQLYSGNP